MLMFASSRRCILYHGAVAAWSVGRVGPGHQFADSSVVPLQKRRRGGRVSSMVVRSQFGAGDREERALNVPSAFMSSDEEDDDNDAGVGGADDSSDDDSELEDVRLVVGKRGGGGSSGGSAAAGAGASSGRGGGGGGKGKGKGRPGKAGAVRPSKRLSRTGKDYFSLQRLQPQPQMSSMASFVLPSTAELASHIPPVPKALSADSSTLLKIYRSKYE